MGMVARMDMNMELMGTDMTTQPTTERLVLQNWFSPSFPIGAFSYSSGLETAIARGHVHNRDTLTEWLKTLLLHGNLFTDAVFLNATIEDNDVNELCLALCASAERHQETTELGAAFCRVMRETQNMDLHAGLAYPVAVGLAARHLGFDRAATVAAFLQGNCMSLISVAVRAVPIGQMDGQACLTSLISIIESATAKAMTTAFEDAGSFAMAADLCALEHETATQRIYRT